MRIQMYSVRPDEQAAIEQWANTHHALILTTPEPLNETTVKLAVDCDAVVPAQHGAITAPVYQQLAAQGIKIIALRITGYDIIDFASAQANQIQVTNVPAYSPRSVAEEALTHTMLLLRHLKETQMRMVQGDFSWGGLEAFEIHNLTVGVLGAGKIGGTVARIFKALGARVIAHDLVERPELADTLDYVSFNELLAQSDVLTIHTNLTPLTTKMIDAAALKQMKPTALLINCARGPIVDLTALRAALDAGTIAGAGLDTIEAETGIFGVDLRGQKHDLAVVNDLLARPNVSVSPHIGFYTDQAVKNMVETALNDAELLFQGRPCAHLVTGD